MKILIYENKKSNLKKLKGGKNEKKL